MFIITADQINSRNRPDLAGHAIEKLNTLTTEQLALPIDRTAGDEIQLMLNDADAALAAILWLTRTGDWSVGCGVGAINLPAGASTRETTGPAFFAARDAVETAKKRETRFALRSETETNPPSSADGEALINLLLQLRARRSDEGWELYDLIVAGETQAAAAHTLSITPQAASKRARVAGIRYEITAITALGRLLAAIEATAMKGSQA